MRFYTNFHLAGRNVVFRGYDRGKRFVDRIPYKPTLYIPAKEGTGCGKRTLSGSPVDALEFENIYDARDFCKRYDGVTGFDIYGSTSYEYVALAEHFGTEWDREQVKIGVIDIEVASADGFPNPDDAAQPVTAITVGCGGKYYTFGCGDYENPDVVYTKCNDERELLIRFFTLWKSLDLDVVTGWNVRFFDIPYLVNRGEKIAGDDYVKMLSPTGYFRERTTKKFNREQREFELVGMATLDYIDIYKKYRRVQRENYKLDYIAHIELGERKLDYSEVETLHQLYLTDYKKFLDYNILDVKLIERLEEKLRYIELAMTIAYNARVNYGDCMTQVRMWDVLIHNHLMERDIVIPPKRIASKSAKFTGAYVKAVQTGMHKWVMSYDLDSLYPSMIVGENISPETLVIDEYRDISMDDFIAGNFENDTEHSLAGNGHFYRKNERGFLPAMLADMMEKRFQYKRQQIAAEKELESVENQILAEKENA